MSSAPSRGTLFCIPTPLGDGRPASDVLPEVTLRTAASLDCFVAEDARRARAFLKQLPLKVPLQSIVIRELNEHSRPEDLPALAEPLLAGRDVGLLSDAGAPGVADPGADLVALAHRQGARVVPLPGPSAVLLALMASGLNGQQFAFAGYVPAAPAEREQRLRELEARSARHRESILIIETPYRADALLVSACRVLQASTVLSVGAQLTQPDEVTLTRRIDEWRRAPIELGKVPAVFGLLAEAGSVPFEAPARSAATRTGRPRSGAPRNGAPRNEVARHGAPGDHAAGTGGRRRRRP